MKIIQSFWSKPFEKPYDQSFYSRFMGGFPLKRYFIYTWALSIMRLKETFKEVHLITDDFGKYLLIDVFELPYDSCSLDLNELSSMPTEFWALGKLKIFSEINSPFLHFDGDVILGDLFDKSIIFNNIIAEFEYEDKNNMYKKVLENIRSEYSHIIIPDYLKKKLLEKNFIYRDYNMGIVGGNNYEFFNNYAKEATKLIANNFNHHEKDNITISFLNCLFEQFLFCNIVDESSLDISLCIKNKFDSNFDYQAEILQGITREFDFVHFHSMYKINYYKISELWLEHYYPQLYNKINNKIFDKV